MSEEPETGPPQTLAEPAVAFDELEVDAPRVGIVMGSMALSMPSRIWLHVGALI